MENKRIHLENNNDENEQSNNEKKKQKRARHDEGESNDSSTPTLNELHKRFLGLEKIVLEMKVRRGRKGKQVKY